MSPHHRSARWRGAGVHTPRELARKARRLDRHSLNVEQVVSELRRGAILLLSFAPHRHWRLSSGPFVPDQVARTVIGLPCVTGVGEIIYVRRREKARHQTG
jgi:hypothetical protein